MSSVRTLLRLAAALALLLVVGLAIPRALRAQACTPEGEDVCPPFIGFSPDSGIFSQPTVAVRITITDPNVSTSPPVIKLNGTAVTGVLYRRTGGTGLVRAEAIGFIHLTLPVNKLKVTACDQFQNCSTDSTFYRLGVPGVEVTPDGAQSAVTAGTSGSQVFAIHNTGVEPATFLLTPECRNGADGRKTACTMSSYSAVIAAGATANVAVSFPQVAAGDVLLTRLRAAQSGAFGVEDAGSADVTFSGAGGAAGAPVVELFDLNSGSSVDRSQCVSASAGSGAAYECGDLRLVHTLPGIVTRNKNRVPALLYNSQHANPQPRVYAWVTLPENAAIPQTVQATITVNGGAPVTRSWPGSEWVPGTARLIAVPVPASGGTGLYSYTLQVRNLYASSNLPALPVAGQIAVVDRAASPYGAGWWVAGLERIYVVGTSRLWVGGDGSTRLFQPAGAGLWTVVSPVDRPEGLQSTSGGGYVRGLRGGARVEFDATGYHRRTITRLSDTTSFAYDGSGRLTTISVPRRDAVTSQYLFAYSGSVLSSVTAPPAGSVARVVSLSHGFSDGRVTAIRNPDTLSVQFAYSHASVPTLATGRTDRRRTTTQFTYDAQHRLASVAVPASAQSVLATGFQSLEGRGAVSSVGRAEAFTRIDGPRADVDDRTDIWLTRWGAPAHIVEPLGRTTLLRREEPNFPALVTSVVAPGGLVTAATYDSRGRVQVSTVVRPMNQANPTTSYTYDDRWDTPITVTQSAAPSDNCLDDLEDPWCTGFSTGGRTTEMAYDTVTGNLLWAQLGDASRRVSFSYHASGSGAGLVAQVQHPAPAPGMPGGAEGVTYDAMGNPAVTSTPLGFLTLHYRDAAGRDTLVVTPIDSAQSVNAVSAAANGARARTGYDLMGRVIWTEALGPAIVQRPSLQGVYGGPGTTPAETLRTTTLYDAEGSVLQVDRWSEPNTAGVGVLRNIYTYDLAGRKLTENDGTGLQYFAYDSAGNQNKWTTQRGHNIISEYDALGRLTRRVVPEETYAPACPPGMSTCSSMRFPYYGNDTGGYVIPGEEFRFRYDQGGRMVWAENLDSQISRAYNAGGSVVSETTRMRAYTGMSYATHVYTIGYQYDDEGRLTQLTHPGNLAASNAATDQYSYDPLTGALTGVTGRLGHGFTFGYDLQDRPVLATYPGGGVQRTTFDVEGRPRVRADSTLVEGQLSLTTSRYDARGKLIQAHTEFDGDASDSDNWYSGLGNLVGTHWTNVEDLSASTELYTVDAMGNQAQRYVMQDGGNNPTYVNRYAAGTGRISMIFSDPPVNPTTAFLPDTIRRTYDASGNVRWATQWVAYQSPAFPVSGGSKSVSTWNLYSADEKLRVLQTHDITAASTIEYRGLFSEYRYDALGRRILERTRRDTVCTGTGYGECASTVTRFVWSGDQLLWELRANGSNGSDVELTDGSGGQYGRVSYLHAGGIDRPLVITRNGASVVPRDNWRGVFATGTDVTGKRVECHGSVSTNCLWIVWPGWRTTASNSWSDPPEGFHDWWGGLTDGMRDASGRMYMRNRYYDPQTGQFTQTDPIGLEGGLNTYAFAQGDPVSNLDPSGLYVCAGPGMRREIERAYKVQIDWGADGCVRDRTKVTRLPGSGAWSELQNQLMLAVSSPIRFDVRSVRFGWKRSETIPLGPNHYEIVISRFQWKESEFWDLLDSNRRRYGTREWGGCNYGTGHFTQGSLIVHEFGHALQAIRGLKFTEGPAVLWENRYHDIHGEPARCGLQGESF